MHSILQGLVIKLYSDSLLFYIYNAFDYFDGL